MMDIGKVYPEVFYWLSALFVTSLILFYLYKCLRSGIKDFWFFYEDGVQKFDFDFLKKIITNLVIFYFASFTFLNVIYFCISGNWVNEHSLQTTKSFIIIGSVSYFFDLLKKSTEIVYQQKKRKSKVNENDITKL